MMIVQEYDLEISFTEAKAVSNFDDDAYHGSSTIQRVDFIAEYEDRCVFIEVKDPDNPASQNVPAFEKKLKSGKLVQSLSGKFRDTLFFRSIQGKSDLSVVYVVLLSMKKLDAALLLTKQDELKRSIPIRHADWARDCATSCIILNVEQWKKQFGDHSIRRISGGAA